MIDPASSAPPGPRPAAADDAGGPPPLEPPTAPRSPAPPSSAAPPPPPTRELSPPAPPEDATPTRARTALSVALVALVYLWVFPYHAQVNNPNENVRVYMTVAIVDDHTFAINRLERDWGYVNDKAIRDGRLYSSKAPGTSYLGVPAYWLLTRITGRNSHPLTAAQIARRHPPPLDRTTIVYVLRLWANVLPALVFAWFWHRFLGKNTRVPALREAVFFSTMVGSPLLAYSEMFASHASNALCATGALMAVWTVRQRDQRWLEVLGRADGAGAAVPAAAVPAGGRVRAWLRDVSPGLMFVAGMLGTGVTLFEYPAGIATLGVALLIAATCAEKRPGFALMAVALAVLGGKLAIDGRKPAAALLLGLAALNYALTLSPRAVARLVAAAAGGAIPVALLMFFHKRAFGSVFKPGYSFLENPQFRSEVSQGFFGATKFNWEAAVRLWLDPAFGLLPQTGIFVAALAGLGAYLSWRPPRRAVWPVRGALLLALVVFGYKTARAVIAAKDAGWSGPAVDQCYWVAYAVLALIALASVSLPRPTRGDLGLGVTVLAICYGLTRLIGMMNNWRGGWQVGPRYLATLVPLLGLAALAGLDAYAQGSAARRRAATVFAAATTLLGMALAGLPGAYFPHIPTEFVSPLFELFVPLLQGGFAPHNAGRFVLHWEGLKGMIPFFAAAAAIAAIVLRGDERRPLPVLSHALAGAALAMALLAPFAAVARYDSMGVTRFVKSVWEPRPPSERRAAGVPVPLPGAAPGAPPAARPETAEEIRARARRLAEMGDAQGAFDAFRQAAAAQR